MHQDIERMGEIGIWKKDHHRGASRVLAAPAESTPSRIRKAPDLSTPGEMMKPVHGHESQWVCCNNDKLSRYNN